MFAVPSGSIVRDWTFVSYRTIGNTNGFRDAITSFARTVMRGILAFGSAKLLAGNVGALAAARPLAGSYTARGSCSGTLISTRSLAGRRHRTRPTLELSRAPNCWLARAPFTRSFRQTMREVLVGDITARTTASGTPFKAISLGPSVSVRTRQRLKPALRWTSVVRTF
jgi:hypothetical protein